MSVFTSLVYKYTRQTNIMQDIMKLMSLMSLMSLMMMLVVLITMMIGVDNVKYGLTVGSNLFLDFTAF